MNVFHDKKEEINLRSCYKDKRATEFFLVKVWRKEYQEYQILG